MSNRQPVTSYNQSRLFVWQSSFKVYFLPTVLITLSSLQERIFTQIHPRLIRIILSLVGSN